jgi:prepilin-type N-terminal cleavage/methylation domain-containing protein
VHLPYLVDLMKNNILRNSSNSGFSLVEMLVVIFIIGILSAIAIPSWLSFVNTRRLNVAQDEIYRAMRQAQSQAKKQKLTWQVSFRESNGIIQWAIHPATANAANINWNNLDANIRLDQETTLEESNGVQQVQFDYKGNVIPPLGQITIYSSYAGKVKRCVYISTILGAMRMAKERATANQNGKYCY